MLKALLAALASITVCSVSALAHDDKTKPKQDDAKHGATHAKDKDKNASKPAKDDHAKNKKSQDDKKDHGHGSKH